MKNFLLLPLVFLLSQSLQAQLVLKPNDKLVYDVNANGNAYNFAIKIKSLAPSFDFAWQMNNEDGDYGLVKVLPTALASSNKMHNYFSNGVEQLSNATSVVISKAAYAGIATKKTLTLYDGDRKFVFSYPDETDYSYTLNGEEKTTAAIYLADEAGNDIVVLKNAANPIILRMNIGWSIKLSNYVPYGNAATDLSQAVGKKLDEDNLLWKKLDKSSKIVVEDLSGIGGPTGEKNISVYKEYFAHMEGLWVKTHNDTITDIIYYPLPLTHSYHSYYGGDMKLVQLKSFTFNKTQAKAMVTLPLSSTTSYGSQVYDVKNGNTMEIYYHTPIKIKDGMEFGITSDKTPTNKQQLGFVTFQAKD